jgi:hypothetical protein
VGIGTASPAYKLDVERTGSGIVARMGTASNVKLHVYTDSGSAYLASDAALANSVQLVNSINTIAFNTNGSERARFNSTGAFVLAGGTTTANGIGITFPTTQSASTNANTLDDYEEGTWTPVINFGGSAGITTYSTQSGSYTKIGNVVTVTCYIAISSKSAATGAATLNGFPFSTSSNASYQTGFIYMSGNAITGAPMTYIGPSASLVNLGQTNGTTGYANLTNTNFSNGGDFIFQTSYLAS